MSYRILCRPRRVTLICVRSVILHIPRGTGWNRLKQGEILITDAAHNYSWPCFVLITRLLDYSITRLHTHAIVRTAADNSIIKWKLMRINPTENGELTRQRSANVTKNFAPAPDRWYENENLSINWNVLTTSNVLPNDFWPETKLILIHWFLINWAQRVVCCVTEKLHAVPTTFGQRPNWCPTLFTFGFFFFGRPPIAAVVRACHVWVHSMFTFIHFCSFKVDTSAGNAAYA